MESTIGHVERGCEIRLHRWKRMVRDGLHFTEGVTEVDCAYPTMESDFTSTFHMPDGALHQQLGRLGMICTTPSMPVADWHRASAPGCSRLLFGVLLLLALSPYSLVSADLEVASPSGRRLGANLPQALVAWCMSCPACPAASGGHHRACGAWM